MKSRSTGSCATEAFFTDLINFKSSRVKRVFMVATYDQVFRSKSIAYGQSNRSERGLWSNFSKEEQTQD
ncbi:UNVERIFIED_CONTAM: hypothetical protein NCL1_29788 [Trichonephila clavipes]